MLLDNRVFGLFLLSLIVTLGCHEDPKNSRSNLEQTNSPQAQEAKLDATVWRNEVLAQRHERTFVQLADDLQAAARKSSVLAAFQFESISIPRTKSPPLTHDLGIQQQEFDDSVPALELSHAAWQKAVAQFEASGWTLAQSEWHHEKFTPATEGMPGVSEFAFELHGEQLSKSNRFIFTGTLAVEWSAPGAEPLIRARKLAVSNLTLLERTGPPGFNNHLLIAPEPSRAGGQVNVHPLIVTDIDGDGDLDIILPGVNKALLNDGHALFQAVPFIAEENHYALKEVGLIADFNGDGTLDFLGVAALGPFANMLVLYPGDGTVPFRVPPVAAWETQRRSFDNYQFLAASVITAGDTDGDGDLDVFVAQYKQPYVGGQMPTPYYDANDGYPSRLLVNDGHGKFELAKAQPALVAKQNRRTLAASFVDLDNDGDLDLITLNDFCGVDMFYNDGHGLFTDQTARLPNSHLFGMSHCFVDFDQDGALDLLAIGMSIPTVRRLDSMKAGRNDFLERTKNRSAMGYGNRLYLSKGGTWLEPPFGHQLARSGWAWGVSAFDLDNDGGMDVYIANGHVSGASHMDYDSQYWTHDIYLDSSQESSSLQRYFNETLRSLNSGKTSWEGYQHNALFLDLGSNHYANIAFLMGVAHESDCRAVASADLNSDGKSDLLVTEAKWQGTPKLMRHQLLVHLNQLETSNHWIGVKLAAQGNGASSIGAKVRVKAGPRAFIRQVVTGDSFQTQHPAVIHFGLGQSTEVEEITVVWPNQTTNVISHPAIDQYHFISP